MIPTKETKALRAFHNDPKIKQKYLDRVTAHEKADEIIHGTYWENGKGCAVGCTIEGSHHERYESELGIPSAIAHLEDCLFEMQTNGDSKTFPRRFLEAIKPGAKLYLVVPKFIVFLLKDVVKVKEVAEDKRVVKAVLDTAKLWQSVIDGKIPKSAAWSAAWSAARSAAQSAARSAASESAAESAARSAARSAAGKKYGDYLIKLLRAAK